MSQTLEVQGSDKYVRFKENRDSTNPSEEIGSAASKEVPLVWTIYGEKVLECEVWVVEEADGGYSAFAAHLPGVVAQAEERGTGASWKGYHGIHEHPPQAHAHLARPG